MAVEDLELLEADVARPELLDATDEEMREAVEHADPMVLRGLLYQLTGDVEVADTRVERRLGAFLKTVVEEDVPLLRRKAAEFLQAYRDEGAGPLEPGRPERLPTSATLTFGEELEGADLELYLEEFALDPEVRSLTWAEQPSEEQLAGFSVTVIGAGMTGLNAALQLKRAGIPFQVIDEKASVGGTWTENRYPGCRVDTPSRGYTHIIGTDFGYPYAFCPREENERYFNWVADTFELRESIVLESAVRSMRWDDVACEWELVIDGPDGTWTRRSNAVVTGTGYLNRPNWPEIEGMDSFGGQSFHTVEWPAEGVDLKGLRVAVIGTGASGYQMTAELGLQADDVLLFQRRPQWLVPVPGYRSPFPPQVNWLDRNLPYYTNFLRFRTLTYSLAAPELQAIDPDFDHPHAVNASNKGVRDACIAFLEQKLGDHPELLAKMIPEHPPLSARLIRVDPEYSVLDAILQNKVTLVSDGIRRITETGIETVDGSQHDVDVIVYATGFRASDYLFPMTVVGRDGLRIEELWREGGARAHSFSMLPGFPNLWILVGPNTGGPLHPATVGELGTMYALECMHRLILDHKKTIEPKQDAYWRFAEMIDDANSRKVWADPRARSYYWSQRHGRSVTQGPLTCGEMYTFLRHPNFDELEIG
jgi:4-hydroxyacetophenone monooxygenase